MPFDEFEHTYTPVGPTKVRNLVNHLSKFPCASSLFVIRKQHELYPLHKMFKCTRHYWQFQALCCTDLWDLLILHDWRCTRVAQRLLIPPPSSPQQPPLHSLLWVWHFQILHWSRIMKPCLRDWLIPLSIVPWGEMLKRVSFQQRSTWVWRTGLVMVDVEEKTQYCNIVKVVNKITFNFSIKVRKH